MLLIILFLILIPLSVQAQEGFIKVTTNLDNYYLIINDDYENVTLRKRGEKIKVPAGNIKVRLIWEGINDYVRTIFIQENQMFEIRPILNFKDKPKNSSLDIINKKRNLSIYTDESSEIFIDNEYVGTGYSQKIINPGSYQLKIINPEFGSLEKKLSISSVKMHEEFRFNKKENFLHNAIRFVPGMEFYSNGESMKALLTWSSLAMIGLNIAYHNNKYDQNYDLYNNLVIEYKENTRQENFILIRNDINSSIKKMEHHERSINFSLVLMGIVYAYTTYESFQKPNSGYSIKSPIRKNRIRLQYEQQFGNHFASVKLIRSF